MSPFLSFAGSILQIVVFPIHYFYDSGGQKQAFPFKTSVYFDSPVFLDSPKSINFKVNLVSNVK